MKHTERLVHSGFSMRVKTGLVIVLELFIVLIIENPAQGQNLGMLIWLRYDPLFNPIRDNPEFQQIVRDVEAKFQAEHERVKQWLEENEML